MSAQFGGPAYAAFNGGGVERLAWVTTDDTNGDRPIRVVEAACDEGAFWVEQFERLTGGGMNGAIGQSVAEHPRMAGAQTGRGIPWNA